MTPKHYRMRITPLNYIIANQLGFCEGNIIKYISRYKEKGGIEDLQKARHYLEMMIDEEHENPGTFLTEKKEGNAK